MNRLLLILLVCACSSASRPVTSATATAMVDASGGDVTSTDGKVALKVPAGALANETEITIRRVTGGDLDPDLRAAGVTEAYELGPAGLQFQTSVEVSLRLDHAPVQQNGALVAPLGTAFLASGGVLEVLENAVTVIDESANTTHVVAEIPHFSQYGFRGEPGSATVRQEAAGDGLGFDLAITVDRDSNTNLRGVMYEDKVTGTAVGSPRFDERENDPIVFADGAQTASGMVRRYTCGARTQSTLQGNVSDVERVFALGDILSLPEGATYVHFGSELTILLGKMGLLQPSTSTLAQVPVPPVPIWSGQLLLLRTPANRVTMFHRIEVRGYFTCSGTAPPPAGGPEGFLSVAGANGFALLDVADDEVVLAPEAADRSFYAAVPFLTRVILGNQWGGFVLIGPGGLEVQYHDVQTGAFDRRFRQFRDENFTDITAIGKEQDGDFVFVNNTTGEVDRMAPNGLALLQASGRPLRRATYASAPGNAVSAVGKTNDGEVLFVTDGQPGEVWKGTYAFDTGWTVTRVGAAGDSPRRIRYCGDYAVVSNFGDGTITVLRWSDAGCEFLGTYAVGDSPIGIDIQVLANGDIAIVSTGFFDNTYWVTVIDPAGGVVSNAGLSVPLGGLNPGHVSFLEDGWIAISCNGSDSIVLVKLDLE